MCSNNHYYLLLILELRVDIALAYMTDLILFFVGMKSVWLLQVSSFHLYQVYIWHLLCLKKVFVTENCDGETVLGVDNYFYFWHTVVHQMVFWFFSTCSLLGITLKFHIIMIFSSLLILFNVPLSCQKTLHILPSCLHAWCIGNSIYLDMICCILILKNVDSYHSFWCIFFSQDFTILSDVYFVCKILLHIGSVIIPTLCYTLSFSFNPE